MCLLAVTTSFIISGCVFYEHNIMLKLTHFKNLYSFFAKKILYKIKILHMFFGCSQLVSDKVRNMETWLFITLFASNYHNWISAS